MSHSKYAECEPTQGIFTKLHKSCSNEGRNYKALYKVCCIIPEEIN